MKYSNTVKARFINRPNRFIAQVETDGRTETVHVKNTGRCSELLVPGCDVILQKAGNPARKTGYDLIAAYKPGIGWINIDSQVPNRVVMEWLESGKSPFKDITLIRPEYTYGKSRVDFYLECGERKILIEVKGCTQEISGKGYFPDAPTDRGVKHLTELAGAVSEGYECFIAFVIAIPGIDRVYPNEDIHPQFGEALQAAGQAGVRVIHIACSIKPDEIEAESWKEYDN